MNPLLASKYRFSLAVLALLLLVGGLAARGWQRARAYDKAQLVEICAVFRLAHTETEAAEFQQRATSLFVSPAQLRTRLLARTEHQLQLSILRLAQIEQRYADKQAAMHATAYPPATLEAARNELDVQQMAEAEGQVILQQTLWRELAALKSWQPGLTAQQTVQLANQLDLRLLNEYSQAYKRNRKFLTSGKPH